VKATIHSKVSRAKLARMLPAKFDAQVSRSMTEPITAVVFRDQVVTGRIARKALERVGSDFGASLVFIARDFTREATETAMDNGVLVIPAFSSWGSYFWSDAQLAESNTSMSTHRPLKLAASDAQPEATPTPNQSLERTAGRSVELP
jgi:hypothetical protein